MCAGGCFSSPRSRRGSWSRWSLPSPPQKKTPPMLGGGHPLPVALPPLALLLEMLARTGREEVAAGLGWHLGVETARLASGEWAQAVSAAPPAWESRRGSSGLAEGDGDHPALLVPEVGGSEPPDPLAPSHGAQPPMRTLQGTPGRSRLPQTLLVVSAAMGSRWMEQGAAPPPCSPPPHGTTQPQSQIARGEEESLPWGWGGFPGGAR